ISGCVALPQHRRKPKERSSESYLISPDYVSRRAIEHSLRSNCYLLLKTECRDRSVDSSLNRTPRTDRDRVARLQLSLASELIGCAEARQRDRTISSRPVSAKT